VGAGLRVCVEDMSVAQLVRASLAGVGARTPYPTPHATERATGLRVEDEKPAVTTVAVTS